MEEFEKQQRAPEGQNKVQNEQDTAAQQSNSAVTQVSNTSDTLPANESDLQKTERSMEERMSAFERSMIRLTRAGVAVAIVTGIIFLGQFYEMYRGSVDTHTLAQAAKSEADKTETISTSIANAVITLGNIYSNSVKSLDIARAEFQTAERPWVGVTHVDKPTVIPGRPAVFTVTVENVGKTPAFISSSLIAAVVQPATKPFHPTFRSTPPGLPGGGSRPILEPGMKIFPSTTPLRPLPAPVVNLIKDGKLILYVYGRINYKDAFGGKHVTQYCIAATRGASGFASCPKYNKAN